MSEVARRRGGAAELHDLDLVAAGPGVWCLDVDRPALVLGSTQPEGGVDRGVAAAAGVEVVRRRSGGGAVLLRPSRSVWVDVVIGRDDPRWVDDVSRSASWLGAVWADALGRGAEVHAGPVRDRDLGRVICFAGLAAGEVTVEGRKVVGISQRRDRRGARFQCVVHADWDPTPIVEMLAPAIGELRARAALTARLRDTVGSVPDATAVAGRVADDLLRLLG